MNKKSVMYKLEALWGVCGNPTFCVICCCVPFLTSTAVVSLYFVQVQYWDQSAEILMVRKASFKSELWEKLITFFQNLKFMLK
jgi:hypothetical protein